MLGYVIKKRRLNHWWTNKEHLVKRDISFSTFQHKTLVLQQFLVNDKTDE